MIPNMTVGPKCPALRGKPLDRECRLGTVSPRDSPGTSAGFQGAGVVFNRSGGLFAELPKSSPTQHVCSEVSLRNEARKEWSNQFESRDWSKSSLVPPQIKCRLTTPSASRISHFGYNNSTVHDMSTSNVVLPLEVFAACSSAFMFGQHSFKLSVVLLWNTTQRRQVCSRLFRGERCPLATVCRCVQRHVQHTH